MAKPFDATLKRIIDEFAPDWGAWLAPLFGLPAGPLVAVESELSTIQPAADKVFRLPGGAGLLHLEVQTSWDGELPDRMLLYNALLFHRERRPVQSVAILLRREANATALNGLLIRNSPDGAENHRFRYGVVRLWELPADELLAAGVGIAPLGLLTDDAEPRLRELVQQFARRVEADVPEASVQDELLNASYLLLGMRYDKDAVDGLFQGVQRMRESSTFQGILAEGRTEGVILGELKALRSTLTMTLRHRFGSAPQAVQDRIASCTDPDRLRAAQDQAFTVDQPEDLLSPIGPLP